MPMSEAVLSYMMNLRNERQGYEKLLSDAQSRVASIDKEERKQAAAEAEERARKQREEEEERARRQREEEEVRGRQRQKAAAASK